MVCSYLGMLTNFAIGDHDITFVNNYLYIVSQKRKDIRNIYQIHPKNNPIINKVIEILELKIID